MSSRYKSRRIVINDSEIYEEHFKKRDVRYINQFKTPRLKHLTAAQRTGLTRIKHVWKLGDRYWKLAAEHYGNPKYWWVIAWYNQRPTENMLNLGNTIIIPKPLEVVLESLRYY
jgi:hypothetical protein